MSNPAKSSSEKSKVEYVEIEEIQTISFMNETRWLAKARFPKTPRGKSIVVFEINQEMIAIPLYCPHEQANLSEGIMKAPYILECPLHHNEYDLRTGVIKAFKVEMIDDKMCLAIGAEMNFGQASSSAVTAAVAAANTSVTATVPVSLAPPITSENTVDNSVKAKSSSVAFSEGTSVQNRSLDEKVMTLEKEINLLAEASKNKDQQLKAGFTQMEKMVSDMEVKKNEMEAAHKSMKAINDFVQRVTNSMTEILIVLDAEGKVKDINKKFTVQLGYKSDEICGKYLDILFKEQDLEIFRKALKDKAPTIKDSIVYSALLTNQKWESEIDLCDKKGTPFIHLLRSSVILSPSGKKEGIVIIGTDIREIREIQNNMNIAYGKVSALLNNMRQGIFVALESGEIIDPVSAYSKSIFTEDITGKKIFETLFKSLDRKSEAYLNLQTAYSTVFNEDDIQWSLMEDLFPRRLIFSSEDTHEPAKVLKIEYCPLWKNDLLERIMFVIEDITKLEQLESQMEEERLANLKNIEILQELAKNKTEDLKDFFENSHQGLEDCRRISANLLNDSKTKEALFRNLHTLKGNARVLGLKKLAQITHDVESNIEEFKHQTHFNAEAIIRSDEGLNAIKKQLSEYGDLAEKVFNIKNDFEIKHINEIHKKVYQLDTLISGAILSLGHDQSAEVQTIPKGSNILSSTFVFQLFENLYEEVRSVGDSDISQTLLSAIECIKNFQEPEHLEHQMTIKELSAFAINYRTFVDRFLNLFWTSQAFNSYPLAANLWVQLYQAVFELTAILERTTDDVSFAQKSTAIETAIEKILAGATSINHETIESLFISLPLVELKEWGHRSLLKQRVQQTWKYLALVSNLETFTLLEANDRKLLTQFLNEQGSDQAGKNDEQRHNYVSTFMGFLNSNHRKGISLKESLSLLASCFGVSINEVVSTFVSPLDETTEKAEFFQNPLIASEKFQPTWDAIFKLNAFSEIGSYYLRKLDYYRALLSFYKVSQGQVDLFFESVQSFNVASSNYHKLLEAIDKIENNDILSELKNAARKLLEVPLVPTFYKYYPMVQDISFRLRKKVEFRIVSEASVTVHRQVLFQLHDAFVHLLRNSLDHGIEEAEARREAGKSERGLVQITCSQTPSGNTQIILSDDGRGIDLEKVVSKAIKMKLISQTEADNMNEREKIELIFKPHLTTSDNVSDLSGRGIGMDVVRTNINQIGQFEITTIKGKGSAFIIILNDEY